MSWSPCRHYDPGVATADVSDRLVEHAHSIAFDDLPRSTVERTKLLILDTLGAAIAAPAADGCAEVHDLVVGWGGIPEAGLIGHAGRVPAQNAARVNATLARALEIDDVHEPGLTHCTATMVPVALATADRNGHVTGRELLTLVALGIDLGARLSMAPVTDLGGSGYKPRSMSRTYQTGTLAGSLHAARLAGLDSDTTKDAFGNAYSQCAGNLQGLAEGKLTVRVQQGLCAQAAIVAMELGPLLNDLGTRFEVDSASVKSYACCKYAHTAIAAAIEITQDPAFDLTDVERVTVHVFSRDCWDLICEPLALKASPDALRGPNGWALAQFSLPYVLACALVRKKVTTDELSVEARTDSALLDMLSKIVVAMEDTTNGLADLPEPGQVEVDLHSGTRLQRRVARAIGHPDRPMSEADQIDKFRWCARLLPTARVERIIAAVLELDELVDITDLTDAVYGAS
jgi:2-methylcitrate dehydratase PrpD